MAHVNPVIDADNHYQQVYDYAERMAEAEREMSQDFIDVCMKGDANALATYAPMVTDWDAPAGSILPGGIRHQPKRSRVHSECMALALGHDRATISPMMAEAMQALINTAYGNLPPEVVKAQVRDLLDRMGPAFARVHAEVE